MITILSVFEISRMTNHNGPGIRTLVHFKGCPLRCKWCSTPESRLREPELLYKSARCIMCGSCMKTCPNGAIKPEGTPDGKMAIVILLLIFCGAMLLLDLMLCGFVKKMSNSKKRRDE